MGPPRRFDPEELRAAVAAEPGRSLTAKLKRVAARFGCSRPTVERAVRSVDRRRDGMHSNGAAGKTSTRAFDLPLSHRAVTQATTLFPSTVMDPRPNLSVLKSGENSAKVGALIVKGAWKDFPIYMLSLEERATCPTTCALWRGCLIPGTPVLTSEMRWVPVEQLTIGDRIAAFDEHPTSGTRWTQIATVDNIGRIKQPCYRIVTDRGEIIASVGHSHLVDRRTFKWITSNELRLGDKLAFFAKPWTEDQSYDAGRLRGFVEGEGTCSLYGNNGYAKSRVSWFQKPGALCDEIISVARRLDFTVSRHERVAGVRKTACSHIDVLGGWREAIRFLGRIRPTRMIEKAADLYAGHSVRGETAAIESIEFLGEREVIMTQTSTGTMVAGGFFTHNCYGNHMHRVHRFRHGAKLEWQLEREVAALELAHPDGFAVRLHGLGDFYSWTYVDLWARLLDRHRALHVFGYTARVDVDSDIIARTLALMVRRLWPRFAIRFSGGDANICTTVTIEKAAHVPPDTIVCPAQTGQTESCATCALCWSTTKRIAFIRH